MNRVKERQNRVRCHIKSAASGRNQTMNTLFNYSDAVAVVSHYDGLGLGIFRGFSAVDVDHCVNTDSTLTAIGQSIAEIFTGCYIEISPSGTGLRVIFKASGFQYDSAKYYINNSKLGVEVYVYGATNKFVTVTGNVYQQGDVIEAGRSYKRSSILYAS
jgi:putative DNA primase/helicase